MASSEGKYGWLCWITCPHVWRCRDNAQFLWENHLMNNSCSQNKTQISMLKGKTKARHGEERVVLVTPIRKTARHYHGPQWRNALPESASCLHPSIQNPPTSHHSYTRPSTTVWWFRKTSIESLPFQHLRISWELNLERKLVRTDLTTVFTEHPLAVPKRVMYTILSSSHTISGQ